MTAALVVAGWLAIGIPLAVWAARTAAKDYRPEKLDPSPGLAALSFLALAPVIAPFFVLYFAQRPITRWALRVNAESRERGSSTSRQEDADAMTTTNAWRSLTAAQRAALVELHETRTDWHLSKRALSSLRAGVELRGEHLAAGETKPLADAGLIRVERPPLGATLYSITERGSALAGTNA